MQLLIEVFLADSGDARGRWIRAVPPLSLLLALVPSLSLWAVLAQSSALHKDSPSLCISKAD